MSTADYTQGEAKGGYGTGLAQPTGMGLPNYKPGRFSTVAPVGPEGWCDEAGCPKRECVHCKRSLDKR